MALPPFGQDRVWPARLALSAGFSYLGHNFIPGRINLVSRWYQQGVGLTATHYPETLSLFYPVQQSAGLLV